LVEGAAADDGGVEVEVEASACWAGGEGDEGSASIDAIARGSVQMEMEKAKERRDVAESLGRDEKIAQQQKTKGRSRWRWDLRVFGRWLGYMCK
jgi:hypothetical protein